MNTCQVNQEAAVNMNLFRHINIDRLICQDSNENSLLQGQENLRNKFTD